MRFIEWLESASSGSSKVRAVLRRSLAFDPGSFPAAFPYVEPFLRGEESAWRREAHYLAAGLWALNWREGRTAGVPIGRACALHQIKSNSASTEQRFIALLDSDLSQLPYRLRQIVALIKDYYVDFDALLKGLCAWNSEDKWVQNQWARDFYRNLDKETEPETEQEEMSP
jgi:CRISPR system Cascade subunit CasB